MDMNKFRVLVIPEKFLEALQKADLLQLPILWALALWRWQHLRRDFFQQSSQYCWLLAAS